MDRWLFSAQRSDFSRRVKSSRKFSKSAGTRRGRCIFILFSYLLEKNKRSFLLQTGR